MFAPLSVDSTFDTDESGEVDFARLDEEDRSLAPSRISTVLAVEIPSRWSPAMAQEPASWLCRFCGLSGLFISAIRRAA
jgi:hypothetical protein